MAQRQVALLASTVIVAAVLLMLMLRQDLTAGHDPAPPGTTGAARNQSANAKSMQGSADAGIAQSTPIPFDSSAPTTLVREGANTTQITWEERAKELLVASRSRGDLGDDALRSALRLSLEPDPLLDPFAVPMPSTKELIGNREINPTGADYSVEETAQLQGLIDEYGRNLRERRRDRHLASSMAMMEAVARGDFANKPNGSDPDQISNRFQMEKQKVFANANDFNAAEIPGSDLSHNRVVILTREGYPDYFSAVDAEAMTRAEYEVAVRSFFLGKPRRRR